MPRGEKYPVGPGHVEFGMPGIHPRGKMGELRGEDHPGDAHLLSS